MRAAEVQFRQWVAQNRPNLLRTATLIAAGDSHLAEDVVQTTVTKIYLMWDRFRRKENPSAYARRMLMNVVADEMRSTRRRTEDIRAELPDRAAPVRDDDTSDLLYAALRELPTGMRSMIVLRYFQDLTVAETARAMRCAPGTVKSQTARALTKLRATLGPVLREVDSDDERPSTGPRLATYLLAPVEAVPAVPISTVFYTRSIA